MSRPFHFKQFSIQQEHTPMKVGTDGVLLGAWCSKPIGNRILDIRTGTGLIALMLAQRFADSRITAIESSAEACLDATRNFTDSPFRERINLQHTSLEKFVPTDSFNLIVSNPPYFAHSLPAKDSGRTMARHQDTFQPVHFAETSKWLDQKGVLAGIYPLDGFENFRKHAAVNGLYLHRKTEVHPTPQKAAHRVLFEFGRIEKPIDLTAPLIIESDGRHGYSPEYKRLTSAFYLNF